MMRALALLAALALVAAFGWIGAQPWLTAPEAASRAQASAPETSPARPLPARAVKTDLTPFTARPLFSAARRPPPPEAPGQPVEDPLADLLFGRYEIAGVVKLGDKALAMLRDARDGGLIRIRAGDRLDEADVVEITLESLTFRQGEATVIAPVTAEGTGDR